MSDPVMAYIRKVEQALLAGNATERTHTPPLKSLLESLDPTITATSHPRRIPCGCPDFVVTKGTTLVGYVEAKDVGHDLRAVEKTDQMKRYLASLSNLILTNYLEFRWYVSGMHRLTVKLADVGIHARLRVDRTGILGFRDLVVAFLAADVPMIGNAKGLAQRMAASARMIRQAIEIAFKDEEDKGGSLRDQLTGFRRVLLHDFTEEQFADMYAQTVSYGMFAARCHTESEGRFTRQNAAYNLPKTNPFLQECSRILLVQSWMNA